MFISSFSFFSLPVVYRACVCLLAGSPLSLLFLPSGSLVFFFVRFSLFFSIFLFPFFPSSIIQHVFGYLRVCFLSSLPSIIFPSPLIILSFLRRVFFESSLLLCFPRPKSSTLSLSLMFPYFVTSSSLTNIVLCYFYLLYLFSTLLHFYPFNVFFFLYCFFPC